MVELLPQTRETAPESEREFLALAKGRTVFVASLRQLVERAQTSLILVGDRLLLPRLRLYDDVYDRIARFQAKGELQVLLPEDAVFAVDGRRIHVDEIADAVRIASVPAGDAMVAVRDEHEILEAHFVPNDLHPSRGSDRVVHNRDPEIAATHARLLRRAWASGARMPSALAKPRTSG